MKKYRQDIDGLRAYAVIAVIIFHLGFLPNGYLGVDVFFVISGYLITSIIYKGISEDNFSVKKFYIKRIRRIIPLLLFITSIAFILGLIYMLPNDLENLAQSVVASNLSLNNILMLITSSDYWAAKNEYKPLMHTWSLGIEEQYYLIYPFLLLFVSKIKLSYAKYFLLLITVFSIGLFLFYGNTASRFYLLQFRFFELSIGGFFALLFYNYTKQNLSAKYIFYISFLALILLLLIPYHNNQVLVILTTIFTVAILASGKFTYQNDLISKYFLQNKIFIYLGKISFSLYLWHQLIFAYARYSFLEQIGFFESVILVLLTFILSVFTYHIIENPFRSSIMLGTRKVLTILSITFILTTSSALYIYLIGGVYKDFPSIGLSKDDISESGFNFFSSKDNIHIRYNEDVRKLDKDFEDTKDKLKVLVIGNSYGRDVANIFLESDLKSKIELRYFEIGRISKDSTIAERWKTADVVIYAAKIYRSKNWFIEEVKKHDFKVDFEKMFCFGTKDFGYSNGIHYNRISTIDNFSNYFGNMKDGIIEIEADLKSEWGNRYVSLLQPLLNEDNEIQIFTDEGLFISQDTLHLTKAGAIFYAEILEKKIMNILNTI